MTVICGDALEVMARMGDNSIDLIATDPPYYKVKGEWWDRQWDDAGKFIEWIGCLCEQWHRILKPNGSLYVFASPKMAARVEVEIGRWFAVLENVTWVKPDPQCELNQGASRTGQMCKETLRSFAPRTEEVIFAEHYGADNIAKGEAGYGAKCDELRGFVFEPLRRYLDDERRAAGITSKECNQHLGNLMSGHYFGQSQWALPTAENYAKMRQLFNSRANHREYLRREYEDLRREYEDLRQECEELRRPFNLTADVPYTDVWAFPTVSHYPGKHPCEKPIEMMRHIVRTSSKPDAVVLDCFAGSGTTLLAAQGLGRQYIGIDIEERWARQARERLAALEQQEMMLAAD